MTTFATVLTNVGSAKLAASSGGGIAPLLSKMGVGEGLNNDYYTIDPAATTLKSERKQYSINALYAHPTQAGWMVAEAVIPITDGGWTIRELGIYTNTGELFAIAIVPASYKPIVVTPGNISKTYTIKMPIYIGSGTTINLLTDTSVTYATQAYVDNAISTFIANNFSYQHTVNGYQDLPGGFILQWGADTIPTAGYLDVTFPTPFLSTVFGRQGIAHIGSSDSAIKVVTWDPVNNASSLTGTRFCLRANSNKKSSGNFSYMVWGK